jgi:hypothetical protein
MTMTLDRVEVTVRGETTVAQIVARKPKTNEVFLVGEEGHSAVDGWYLDIWSDDGGPEDK